MSEENYTPDTDYLRALYEDKTGLVDGLRFDLRLKRELFFAWQSGAYWVSDAIDNYDISLEADKANPYHAEFLAYEATKGTTNDHS
jgi:hypothetical protein